MRREMHGIAMGHTSDSLQHAAQLISSHRSADGPRGKELWVARYIRDIGAFGEKVPCLEHGEGMCKLERIGMIGFVVRVRHQTEEVVVATQKGCLSVLHKSQ